MGLPFALLSSAVCVCVYGLAQSGLGGGCNKPHFPSREPEAVKVNLSHLPPPPPPELSPRFPFLVCSHPNPRAVLHMGVSRELQDDYESQSWGERQSWVGWREASRYWEKVRPSLGGAVKTGMPSSRPHRMAPGLPSPSLGAP